MLQQPAEWADHICVVAAASACNVVINIIESSPNFNPVTMINPLNPVGLPRDIYIGHMNENHYVSTKPKYIIGDENIRDSNDCPKCEREISGFRCISTRVSAGDHNALPKNFYRISGLREKKGQYL